MSGVECTFYVVKSVLFEPQGNQFNLTGALLVDQLPYNSSYLGKRC